MFGLSRGVLIALAGSLALGAATPAHASSPARTEVVVTLTAPGLADAVQQSRVLTVQAKARRLDLHSASSVSYLQELSAQQDAVAHRIERAIPSATVRWRYKIVLDGLAVALPTSELPALARIGGITAVYPDTTYQLADAASQTLIGADQIWGLPNFSTAGNGIKVGIVDEGIDQAHTFYDATGYVYPPGFPKGNTAFTTPKVIVARAFPPPGETWQFANAPFDPILSEHATHVAGIAAGDYTTSGEPSAGPLAGIAPRAYLGNYKALTVPTGQFGLDGNAPELAAAVEAAVSDGMDVVNLSLGEPEIEPSRDILVAAINGAAKAGVVPTIAAGNEYQDFGNGSVSSPGTASGAITAAAATKSDTIAPFSSGGPTPITLELKPDVSAPGVSILSSVPPRLGLWSQFSGTSMAAPHVAGAAALLRQRHPSWTVEQIKSALVLTGKPVLDSSQRAEVPTTREGGGLIWLPAADNPLVFAEPTSLSFGLLTAGKQTVRTVQLTDVGGGSGTWNVSVSIQDPTQGITVTAPASVTVPAALNVQAAVAAGAAQADVTGFVVLQRSTDTRRIPIWLRSEQPRLGRPSAVLTKPGIYHGDARRGQPGVLSYRYPDNPSGAGLSNNLPGPAQVFRIIIRKPVANLGAVVIGAAASVHVTPRLVIAGDENRIVGIPGLPVDENPYLPSFGNLEPIVAAIAPTARAYDLVFATRSRSVAGPFTFRLWINDTTPPTTRLVTHSTTPNGQLLIAATDAGSGIDPNSVQATIDNRPTITNYTPERIVIQLHQLTPGRHRLEITISAYQEQKNMETYGTILPNTRTLDTTFIITTRPRRHHR